MDRVRNEQVRRRAGIERELEYRMARRVLMAEVIGGRVRGRPKLGWMDGVKVSNLRQQRNDGGGCTTKRETSERVDSPGTYVTE